MHKTIMFAALLLFTPTLARADDRADVKAAVDQWLAALNANDADAFVASQLADGMTFRQAHEADGVMKLTSRGNAEWADRVRTGKDRLHEQYWQPKILVHGGIAVFWAPYSFDINGQRSHCGVDVFDLVKADGRWKVANAMWTVEPDGCPKK